MSRRRWAAALAAIVVSSGLAACRASGPVEAVEQRGPATAPHPRRPVEPTGVVTLAFAGDVHFQLHLAALLERPRGALGPMARILSDADLAMVNLESSITDRGTPDPKELESPADRYYFRTPPRALDALAAAGVDVVGLANNHAVDWGQVGLRDTLRAVRRSPIPVVGIGRNRARAFAPYRVTVRGTEVAFLAADTSFREGMSPGWSAGAHTPGIADARARRPRVLLSAVRAASRRADVVVVYLHWGVEGRSCPSPQQWTITQALARAGADVVVGSHAHTLLGSGWSGDTYVNYGLGNFLWYHDHQPETGVLRLRIENGKVVRDGWTPARMGTWGRPIALRGSAGSAAVADWRRLRGCSGLAGAPPDSHTASAAPDYRASRQGIGPALRARMRWSHRPGCPVPLRDLRYLRMTYLGFDGMAHTGEMVVHAHYARAVARVFRRLYDARWPIQRMRLVDDYRGDDARSMAANNTSGYNCRRVAGQEHWSDHARGAAVDLNPVQNPDLTGGAVSPPVGSRFVGLDRSGASPLPLGVIHRGDVVARAFARVGWEWGGDWSPSPDYQHFAAR